MQLTGCQKTAGEILPTGASILHWRDAVIISRLILQATSFSVSGLKINLKTAVEQQRNKGRFRKRFYFLPPAKAFTQRVEAALTRFMISDFVFVAWLYISKLWNLG
ncbi:MAG: hypothetical protein WCH99_02870 [Verrucomicrobiota bacterium]